MVISSGRWRRERMPKEESTVQTVIVIPVHNAPEHVKLLLEDIDRTVARSVPVIFVDDCSRPETVQILEQYTVGRRNFALYERAPHILRNDRQQLFTRTVNRGIRYAVQEHSAELVIVINTDCRLENGWFEEMINAFHHPNVGMAGFWDTYPEVDWTKKPFTEVKLPDYITGHCFGLRVAMLQEIGVLCETDTDGRGDRTLAPFKGQAHIGSERILCNKANIYAWKTRYINRPLVQHGQGASWGRDLGWLSQFDLQPLWEACDTLDEVTWRE
jgi:glycosyltransferase involved in cell wall biosynthesis